MEEEVLSERLRVHVERVAGLIGPRHVGRPSLLEATAVYIQRQFESMGYAVERQEYDAGGVR